MRALDVGVLFGFCRGSQPFSLGPGLPARRARVVLVAEGVLGGAGAREIEELTGRKVIGFMSDNHIDPDLAVEVFVLEPLPSTDTH